MGNSDQVMMEALARRRSQALSTHPMAMHEFASETPVPVPGNPDQMQGLDVPHPMSTMSDSIDTKRQMSEENQHDAEEAPQGESHGEFMNETMKNTPMAPKSLRANALTQHWEKFKKSK